jgi:chitin synthase
VKDNRIRIEISDGGGGEGEDKNPRLSLTTELLNEMDIRFNESYKSPYALSPEDVNKHNLYCLNNGDNEFLPEEKQKQANVHVHLHPVAPPRNVSRKQNTDINSSNSINDDFSSSAHLTISDNVNDKSIRIVSRTSSRIQRHTSYNVKSLSKDPNLFLGKQVVLDKPQISTQYENREGKPEDNCCFGMGWWSLTTAIMTCWIPSFMLKKYGGMTSPMVQKAWREKVTLCLLIFLLCVLLGFFTYSFTTTFCKKDPIPTFSITEVSKYRTDYKPHVFIIHGDLYDLTDYLEKSGDTYATEIFANYTGKDASPLFRRQDVSTYPKSCTDLAKKNKLTMSTYPCTVSWSSSSTMLNHCFTIQKSMKFLGRVTYNWDELQSGNRILINGKVADVSEYMKSTSKFLGKSISSLLSSYTQRDATRKFYQTEDGINASQCISELFPVGQLNHQNSGCFFATTAMNTSVFVILLYVLTKFFLAVIFSWLISHRLGKLEKKDTNKPGMVRSTSWEDLESPFTFGRDNDHDDTIINNQSYASGLDAPSNIYLDEYGDIYTVLLVTCYSENESGIRTTLESLSKTMYDNNYKLLFVVADGLIKGEGNTKTTPEIIIDMITLDKRYPPVPIPQSYIAIADGTKRHNKAQVYVGWFNRTPIVVVVKCGTESEQKAAKPGNRGKRDSQIIVMNFFQKVLFNDPMVPLEFDLFTKIHTLMGITPDLFEIILMVDADTKVAPDSLARLVAAMVDDPMIMGLCGETRISNKSDSWVTKIQVFEYYISHHMSKAFESIFGGVTCLPGCFCMYRIKAPLDDGYWQPIISHPNIIQDYSQNVVETLHEKNLLFLGEDRFLTTLMLKTFPSRKLMFVPKAYCKTMVPDTFPVLLSQRRRWINSTIHNLFELVFVRQLCGIFCFSMQFVIALELFGTLTLPAAIIFTFILIIVSFIGPVVPIVPLIMLACILGLPAVLVAITSRRLVYIAWMLIYLCALPIWNFVLPTYAYWHFDDFSWGETRKVQGDDGAGHGPAEKEETFDIKQVPLRKWADYEKDRRRNLTEKWETNIKKWKGQLYPIQE